MPFVLPIVTLSETELLARILYRDALVLVIDKPSGLPVHPGSGGGVTLSDYLDALRFGLPQKPQLAHRLDRETSGCLVLGRHRQALARLGDLFAQNRIGKTYWAVVHGVPEARAGTIDLPLGKASAARHRWRMRPDPEGQKAVTYYRLLASDGMHSWLELSPETGRTHQLRVHCAAMGWPILGDRIYGSIHDVMPLHLHARKVTVPLYLKRPPIEVEAPPPLYFQEALVELKDMIQC